MQVRARREDLDIAKGLGILLVVFGHIVAREPPGGNDWYVLLKSVVYQFHMPFFMYLSGYVSFLSGAARTSPRRWPALAARRAGRLLLPFLLFGLAIVAGKFVAARFIYVDNMPGSASQALLGLLWNTDHSPAFSVWYLEVLFALSILTPPLLWAARGRVSILLAVSLLLYTLPIPHLMYLDRVATFCLFFALGGWAAESGERWLAFLDKRVWLCLALFLVLLVVASSPMSAGVAPKIKLLLAGMLSMPALHGLCRRPNLRRSSILMLAGSYSFVIYLLNTPCIGLAKGVLLQVLSWDGVHFLLYAPVLMLSGFVGPILIKKIVLRRLPPLDRITE